MRIIMTFCYERKHSKATFFYVLKQKKKKEEEDSQSELYLLIRKEENGERLLFYCRCTWISSLQKVLETEGE